MKSMKIKLVTLAVLMIIAIIPALAMDIKYELNNENLVQLENIKITTEGSGANEVITYELTAPEDLGNGLEILYLKIEAKADPFVNYGLAVMNNNAGPAGFTFTFANPIAPAISGSNYVKSSFSASTTDGGTNGVTITAVAPPAGIPVDGDGITELQVTTVFDGARTNIGHDLAGPSVSLPGQSGAWGPFVEGFFVGPASATGWNEIRMDVNFQLSGGGDIMTFNGRSDITKTPNVPEFPSIALPVALIVGLIGSVIYIQKSKEN